jgi:hypothetical protein
MRPVVRYEDTHNTLKYANRAKNIKASVTCNKTLVDKHVSQYAELVTVHFRRRFGVPC